MEFVKMVQESDEAFAAVAFGDAVKTRIRPNLRYISELRSRKVAK